MTATPVTSDTRIRLRRPTRRDGARVHALVQAAVGLEANTRYAYLLLTEHFRDTCLVAELDDGLVGFVAAYRLPDRPQTLFVWQVGVAAGARRMGLGRRMLLRLLARLVPQGVLAMEATVAVDNEPSAVVIHLWSNVQLAKPATWAHRAASHFV